MDVDDDVDESRRVDRARVLIRTTWSPGIQHTVYVNIGGEEYTVHVVEEIQRGIESCTCRRRRDTWSSEEIDSDDSCFDTPTAVSSPMPLDDAGNFRCPRSRNMADLSLQSTAQIAGPDGARTDDIPIGSSGFVNPLDNHLDQRIIPDSQACSRTDTCALKSDDDAVSLGPLTNSSNQNFKMKNQKQKEKECGGSREHFEEDEGLHKKGNIEGGRAVAVEEDQSYARDRHVEAGVDINVLGPSSHTPKNAKPIPNSSPNRTISIPTNNWKVYSRLRGYKRRIQTGSLNEAHQDSVKQLNHSATQQLKAFEKANIQIPNIFIFKTSTTS